MSQFKLALNVAKSKFLSFLIWSHFDMCDIEVFPINYTCSPQILPYSPHLFVRLLIRLIRSMECLFQYRCAWCALYFIFFFIWSSNFRLLSTAKHLLNERVSVICSEYKIKYLNWIFSYFISFGRLSTHKTIIHIFLRIIIE